RYTLGRGTAVSLSVYDVLGRKVKEVALGMQPAGAHEILLDATDLSPGLYVYRLGSDVYSETKRMMVVK
ncbi:MAG: T9SS type A sorting domain-containing protein, partial [Rhodothermales bacterium]|nr:T9SS type A sorting domain-containing protein [Rhodothermales bacterium]